MGRGFTKGTVTIRMLMSGIATNVTVPAYLKNGLAVHHVCIGREPKTRKDKGLVRKWTVAHIASGLAVFQRINTLTQAKKVCDALLAIGVDWSKGEKTLKRWYKQNPANKQRVEQIREEAVE